MRDFECRQQGPAAGGERKFFQKKLGGFPEIVEGLRHGFSLGGAAGLGVERHVAPVRVRCQKCRQSHTDSIIAQRGQSTGAQRPRFGLYCGFMPLS